LALYAPDFGNDIGGEGRVCRSGSSEAPFAQHQHVIGMVHRVGETVHDDDHPGTTIGKLPQMPQECAGLRKIEAGKGFVGEDPLRLAGEDAGEEDAGALAAR
jgi:hypothetical protein